jgi:hypothetical protein
VVLNKWALHEILKAKERISVIEDGITLGRTFRNNLFRYPAETFLRIGNPLQILSRMRLTWVRRKSGQYFGTIPECFGGFE